jgi:hypothetical protein
MDRNERIARAMSRVERDELWREQDERDAAEEFAEIMRQERDQMDMLEMDEMEKEHYGL